MNDVQTADQALTGFRAVLDACAGLSPEQQLIIPLVAWLAIADSTRNAAFTSPGGYEGERKRQLNYLERAIQLVKTAKPDAELQRLRRLGDWTGALKHITGSIGRSRDAGGAPTPRG
jgi:hypothetical protein